MEIHSLKSAADKLGINQQTLKNWIVKFKFKPSITEGTRVFFTNEDIEKLQKLKNEGDKKKKEKREGKEKAQVKLSSSAAIGELILKEVRAIRREAKEERAQMDNKLNVLLAKIGSASVTLRKPLVTVDAVSVTEETTH